MHQWMGPGNKICFQYLESYIGFAYVFYLDGTPDLLTWFIWKNAQN